MSKQGFNHYSYQGFLVLDVEEEHPGLLLEVSVADDVLLHKLFVRLIKELSEHFLVGIETLGVLEGTCTDQAEWHLGHDFFKTKHVVRADNQNGSSKGLEGPLHFPFFLLDWDGERALNLEKDV